MSNLLKNGLAGAMLLAATAGISAPAQAGATIDAIRQRGEVVCGVSTGIGGFSIADSSGQWTGLTTDFCRAVSSAVLGDAAKEKFVPLSPQQRFTALQSGEVDMLTTVATWTLTRDASLGLLYAGVYFYDGQGFLVSKSLDLKGALDLDGASICTATGTTSELNLADYFRAKGKKFTPVVFESQNEARAAFFSGRCEIFERNVGPKTPLRMERNANALWTQGGQMYALPVR
ncbi:transporter substrate-binding domain-containing protein [Aminobacter anthyllidis]|uniref:Transporter substrate-binding domain-containing protein n=1 Tax=Aminobacter anthyllidis TaxID=1035067 RepID=A0A9X1ADM1_9HYPH|nr:transporter substrate-binding domain-containing protein [Aminobacter anthyllidis]MBT1157874.1 transporter substrate-binding domain-containing protein [Aminobacter anthyllidis]